MPAPRKSIRPMARPSAPRRSIRPMARPIDLTPRAEAGDQMFVRRKGKGYNKGGYVNCGASVPGTQKK